MSHLRPSNIKPHQAEMSAIEMKDAIELSRIHMNTSEAIDYKTTSSNNDRYRNEGCDCALTDTHETDTSRHLHVTSEAMTIKLHQATMTAIETKDAIALSRIHMNPTRRGNAARWRTARSAFR